MNLFKVLDFPKPLEWVVSKYYSAPKLKYPKGMIIVYCHNIGVFFYHKGKGQDIRRYYKKREMYGNIIRLGPFFATPNKFYNEYLAICT